MSVAVSAAATAVSAIEEEWVEPAWMEYQTDSDDDEDTVARKKALKAKVMAKRKAKKRAREDAAMAGSSNKHGTSMVAPGPQTTPWLTKFLAMHRLAEYEGALRRMGAKVVEDLVDVEEADLVGMGMNLLAQRRFMRVSRPA